MNPPNVRLALVGLPAAGKTSFLAALHGVRRGTVGLDAADWVVAAHPESHEYLRDAWNEIKSGYPVTKTLPVAVHPRLRLTLTRRRTTRDGAATHVFDLDVLDSSGEFVRETSRAGEVWKDVAGRILDAHVLLLLMDAMNVFHTHRGSDAQAREVIDGFTDMLSAALRMTNRNRSELEKKLLAVCLTKCDAVCHPRIDGINDDEDAKVLATSLLTPTHRETLKADFADVRYFGISVLGEQWRWSRGGVDPGDAGGACVKVGGGDVEPEGLFHPFEWIAHHPRLRA